MIPKSGRRFSDRIMLKKAVGVTHPDLFGMDNGSGL